MIDWTRAGNMADLLDLMRQEAGDRVIMRYMDGRKAANMTGTEFFAYGDQCAGYLAQLGLAGKHIGIMGANRWQWMAWLCGIFQVGAVAVLLSPDLNEEELKDRAGQTDLAAIVCDDSLMTVAKSAGVETVSLDAIPKSFGPSVHAEAEPEDLACILFTSGTTARCRAAVFSHRAVIAGVCHNVIGFPFEAQLAILPMHHIAGFASVLNTWYLNRVVCMGEHVKYLYRYLRDLRADYVLTVPALLQAILKRIRNAKPNGADLGWDLRMVGCGGAKFPPEVIRSLNDKNIRVLQSYGATEAGGIGFDWEMTPECSNSIGKPCPEMETKIVDGELYLRCGSMMSEYYKDPEQTAEVLVDGWYATGDLCEMDENGYLYLRGRKKNLIILSNGENVSPEEIEAALMRMGLRGEMMVGEAGGLITAWIYPEIGQSVARIEALVEEYNRNVPRYKQIQDLQIVEQPFEKTDIGKIRRMR